MRGRIARNEFDGKWYEVAFQFVVAFGVYVIPAGLVSGLCTLLKWEDNRARQNEALDKESAWDTHKEGIARQIEKR
jgi:hypothetical protein